MIKQIINKLFSQKISEEDIECAIDENIVDCEHFDDDQDKAYVGVPAPVMTPHDNWFEDPPKTEMQMEYEHINDDPHDGWWMRPEHQDTKEPENIHQLMYERASKYWGTWKEELPGGSENFHENNGWNSGTGLGQFK